MGQTPIPRVFPRSSFSREELRDRDVEWLREVYVGGHITLARFEELVALILTDQLDVRTLTGLMPRPDPLLDASSRETR